MSIFLLIPVQYRAELAAIVAEFPIHGALTLVDAETPGRRVVADVARLDDDEILAMMGMRPVAVEGDLAADQAVIEREGAEMLGHQHDRIALAFVRTEGPRRHHCFALKTERQAVIVQPGNEQAVTHRAIIEPEILNYSLHWLKPREVRCYHSKANLM